MVYLKKAINNDKESFHEFLKIEVKINELYDHREVLLQLFDLKEDSLTIISINKLTKIEKSKLIVCLNFGVWDTNLKKYKGKSFKELFPEVKLALYK